MVFPDGPVILTRENGLRVLAETVPPDIPSAGRNAGLIFTSGAQETGSNKTAAYASVRWNQPAHIPWNLQKILSGAGCLNINITCDNGILINKLIYLSDDFYFVNHLTSIKRPVSSHGNM